MNSIFRYTVGLMAVLLVTAESRAAEFLTTIHIPALANGRMVNLIDTDNGSILDSLPVSDGTIVFPSDRYKPSVIQIAIGNDSYGTFILNDASITMNVLEEEIEGGVRRTWESHGGYNDSLTAINSHIFSLREQYRNAPTNHDRDSIGNILRTTLLSKIADNADNILGYRILLMSESMLTLADIVEIVASHPGLKEYKRVNDCIARKRTLNATRAGQHFADFSVTYDGVTHRLSDIVGKGQYILLDFWAFWCAPCRAEMPYIKEVYDRYKDKNLKIIGVAVSDTPEKDLKAAADLQLPWEIWLNAAPQAMDAYSIKSIPHLILIGPDGTILARNFRTTDILPTIARHLD